VRRSLGLGLGFALTALIAAPAHADTVSVIGTDALVWDKPVVDIKPGDIVEWSFPNTAQYHNVMIEFPLPKGTVKSVGGLPAPSFSQDFPDTGEFTFLCEVHQDTMRGVVRVNAVAPPPPPPPPLSAQAYDNTEATILAAEAGVTFDKTKPKLSSVSAKRVAKGAARVRLRVSEDSDVSVAFKRGGKTIKSGTVSGSGARSLTVRGLKAGRYSVQVRATDIAGNRSSLRKLTLNVR
jgi:plastocyanin